MNPVRESDATPSSAAQLYRALVDEFGDDNVPSERTIRGYFNELTMNDNTGLWALGGGADRADYLLTVLRAVFDLSEGRVHELTKAEANWVEEVAAAVPEAPPGAVFLLAREYIRAGGDAGHLDFALAMTPSEAEASQQLSEPDQKAFEARADRHLDLHARQWANRDLTMWARSDYVAQLYINKAVDRGGHMLAWDDRPQVEHFLQVRV